MAHWARRAGGSELFLRTSVDTQPSQPQRSRRQLSLQRRRGLLLAGLAAGVLVLTSAGTDRLQNAPLCDGRAVTVDIGSGQAPTPGDDVILGTVGDDVIDALAGNDVICALDGADQVLGNDGNDKVLGGDGHDYLRGNEGNDTILGGGGNDFTEGGRGNDVLNGGGGNDQLIGHFDHDRLDGGPGNDYMEGGDGSDWLHGSDGNDILHGNAGDDIMNGDRGDDIIHGEGGNDRILGADGIDTIHGGDGDDYLRGNRGDDIIHGGDGNDFAEGGWGNDVIHGGDGNDSLIGHNDDDQLSGGPGNDYARGGNGDDWIRGEEGNDHLHGDDGIDRLFGGPGADRIDGGRGSDVIDGGPDADTLNEYDGYVGNPYASPLNIANAPLNQGPTIPASIPIHADVAGCITEWTFWGRFSYATTGQNYSRGDGGRYLIEIVADDGSGNPDRYPVLDSNLGNEYEPGLAVNGGREFGLQDSTVPLNGRACVQPGETVHVVISNVHEDPANNYLSLNGPYLLDRSGSDEQNNQNMAEAVDHCPDCHVAYAQRFMHFDQDGDGEQDDEPSWGPFPDSWPHLSRYVYMPYQCLKLDTGAMLGNDNKYGKTGLYDNKLADEPQITGDTIYVQTFDYSATRSIDPDAFQGPVAISFYAAKFAGDDPLEVWLNDELVGQVSAPTVTNAPDQAASMFDWHTVEAMTGLRSDGPNTLAFRTGATSTWEVSSTVETDGDHSCNTDRYSGHLQYSEDGGATLTNFIYNGASATNVQAAFYVTQLD